MPNHFLTIGLCARDHKAIESKGLEERPDMTPLNGAELCGLLLPLPEELKGIVATTPLCRYRHKETGEWYQDANGPHGEDCRKWEKVVLPETERAELTARFGAACWYDWQINRWGTKWGTYQVKAHELGGDGSPVLIEFESAWCPPNPEMMRRIDDYLCETFCLKNIKWIGHEPYDGSTVEIEVGITPGCFCMK